MNAPVEARVNLFVRPKQMRAAAAYVDREYGDYGYTMAVAWAGYHVAVWEVRHFDGSRFNLIVDEWENVTRIPDGTTTEEAEEMVLRITAEASKP